MAATAVRVLHHLSQDHLWQELVAVVVEPMLMLTEQEQPLQVEVMDLLPTIHWP
jgi:hypothetical protein